MQEQDGRAPSDVDVLESVLADGDAANGRSGRLNPAGVHGEEFNRPGVVVSVDSIRRPPSDRSARLAAPLGRQLRHRRQGERKGPIFRNEAAMVGNANPFRGGAGNDPDLHG